jgi:hypothetical protein
LGTLAREGANCVYASADAPLTANGAVQILVRQFRWLFLVWLIRFL